MATSSAAKDARAGRAFIWIAAVALVLAAALTGAWYYLANQLDTAVREAIEAAAGGGTAISCGNQRVFGYPFRLGLRCDAVGVAVAEKGVRAQAGALRTAAQIYEPTRLVAELDGPLRLETRETPPLAISWGLLQTSTHFWTEGVDRLAVVIEKPQVALAEGGDLVRSDHLEVHARRNGEDLDFALTDDGVKALQPGLEALPVFAVAADLTVAGAADWLSGRRPGDTPGEALRGRKGTIRSLALSVDAPGNASVGISGPFEVDEKGRVSGRFDVGLTDPDAIADLVGQLVPDAQGIAGTVASGIGLAGRTENGRTVVRIDVKRGKASLGFIPLGKIPPIE